MPNEAIKPVLAALKEIEEKGNLLCFAPERRQRLSFMQRLSKHKLILWNAQGVRYELTLLAGRLLAEYSR
jgi:hypothetical protein